MLAIAPKRASENIMRGPDFIDLHHRAILEDPSTAAKAACDFVRDGLDAENMTGVVDTTLYLNRAGV